MGHPPPARPQLTNQMVHFNAPAPAPGRIRPNRSGGAAIAGDSHLKATIEAIYLSVAAGRRTFHDGLGGSV